MNKRRKFTSSFKTKVVLEALSERHTLQELSRKYEVHPNQIAKWKAMFLESASQVFENGKNDNLSQLEQERERLLKIIGEQKVDIDFLKKALS